MAVSIRSLARPNQKVWTGWPLSTIAAETLPGWEISLAFVGPERARMLNKKLRRKAYVPNVLSYVVGKKSGEIIICPSEAAKQAPDFKLSTANFQLLLFIHGLLHLKGWAHGGTMERREQALLARYLLVRGASSDSRIDISHEAAHRHRNRHRDLPGKTGRR
ncbi:rRNA maturation RNase YbeY [Candidatus Kaiserbacteria bacterium]|nr:rRNA maturation RNase YbeY [Candidatus Kaiserbacteria bacterium]